GCLWTASSSLSWIVVDTGSHSTPGAFSFTVAANSGSTRTGTLTVAGVTISVAQAAPSAPPASSCNYSIDSATLCAAASGVAGATVSVTAGAGCPWTASANASWLSITSGAAGSGNGQVVVGVAPNASTTPRVGTLTIASQTFTVSQAGITAACTFAL